MADGFTTLPIGCVVQACPISQRPKPYWIEIELLGEDDSPIPYEEYIVELPNGDTATGFLDSEGFARIQNIEAAGTCRVSFPKLDSAAWAFVEALDAKGL